MEGLSRGSEKRRMLCIETEEIFAEIHPCVSILVLLMERGSQ